MQQLGDRYFFSSIHGGFININHILDYKGSLKYKSSAPYITLYIVGIKEKII